MTVVGVGVAETFSCVLCLSVLRRDAIQGGHAINFIGTDDVYVRGGTYALVQVAAAILDGM